LQEVIVGTPYHYNTQEDDLSFRVFFHDNIFSKYWKKGATDVDRSSIDYRRHIDEMAEDLDGISAVLEKEGVRVRRPALLKDLVPFSTPYWSSYCVPCLNVRDLTLIVGDEIIETPIQIRSRYFENDFLKPLFHEYFMQGAKWTCAPRPLLLDRSIDLSYVLSRGASAEDYRQKDSEQDFAHEMMIDAAQCLRFGRDIVVNVANENHRIGLQWLRRHLGDEYRLHDVHIADNHIDASIMPLRPGALLVNPEYIPDPSVLPEFLRKWELIEAPEPLDGAFPIYGKDTLLLASKYVDINILSIDEQRVMVNEAYTPLITVLEKHGFTPIPVRLRHRRVFAGGIHCMTLDVARNGELEDYAT